MRICWASILGGCGGGFTGEHVLSKGLFTGKSVHIQGSPWTRGKTKSIGINSLTANMLCSNHNSGLSDVDDEGIKAFHAIRRFEEVLSGRKKDFTDADINHNVCGPLLERWFIKHAINLFVVSNSEKKWQSGIDALTPPLNVVEAAFGRCQFERPQGLYNWAGTLGETRIVGDQVGFVPISNKDQELVGALFEFQALRFLIWLCSHDIPWPAQSEFYHHMGGIFQSPPTHIPSIRASFNVIWSP